MNIAYINKKNQSFFLTSRPEIMRFPTGHSLIVFPGRKNKAKLEKNLQKYDAVPIKPFSAQDFADKVHLKAIKQAIKEKAPEKIVFIFKNALEHIQFLQGVIKEEIPFGILIGQGAAEVNDYFLEKSGIPLKISNTVSESLAVYFDGEIPPCSNYSKILNLSGRKISGLLEIDEYILKGTAFPLKINSLPLLEAALFLTGKDISEVIAKIGIFEYIEE